MMRIGAVYFNENIMVLFFVALFFLYLAVQRGTGLLRLAIIPGILVGLAVGSKISLAPLLIPALGYAVVVNKEKIFAPLVLGLTALATYFVVNPYSLIDLPQFLHGTAYEIGHYTHNHEGHSSAVPGWDHATKILAEIQVQLGVLAMPLAAVGLGCLLWRRSRPALVAATFLGIYFAYFSSMKVFFPRNYLVLALPIAAFAGVGAVEVGRFVIAGRWLRWLPTLRRPALVHRLAAVGVIAGLMGTIGYGGSRYLSSPPSDNLESYVAQALIDRTNVRHLYLAVHEIEQVFRAEEFERRGIKLTYLKQEQLRDLWRIHREEKKGRSMLLVADWGAMDCQAGLEDLVPQIHRTYNFGLFKLFNIKPEEPDLSKEIIRPSSGRYF